MGMAFRVDADGRPVVTRASFELYDPKQQTATPIGRVNMPVRQRSLQGPAL
jgi:hypothetical protein